ncbi:MAG: lipid A-modifier LpxR family protein [Bacteroidota bacterium]
MRLFICCLTILATLYCGFAQTDSNQEPVYENLIELRHDNDFPVFTDRYYTTGNFIGWRKLLEKGTDSTDQKQYRLYLIQELFTPADILETEIRTFDRPFAGFLGFSNGYTLANSRRLFDLEVFVGISGPYSGGSFIQEAFHSAPAVSSRIPTWLGQIQTAVFGNAYVRYTREWQWEPNPFSVHCALTPEVAIGNRDMYAQQEAAFFFGRRSALQSTSAYKQLGSTANEYFFTVRTAYRYILHDASQEGDLIGDSSPLLRTPYRNMFLYDFEMNARIKRYNFMVAYRYATPINRRSFPHLYVTLSIAKTF